MKLLKIISEIKQAVDGQIILDLLRQNIENYVNDFSEGNKLHYFEFVIPRTNIKVWGNIGKASIYHNKNYPSDKFELEVEISNLKSKMNFDNEESDMEEFYFGGDNVDSIVNNFEWMIHEYAAERLSQNGIYFRKAQLNKIN
jgi:hypothetical protein